jgi:hypothetical protein
MTRRGISKNYISSHLNKQETTPITSERGDKSILRIMRIPNSKIGRKTKAITTRRASLTKTNTGTAEVTVPATTVAKVPATSSIFTKHASSTTQAAEIIPSDISDYYLTDNDDTSDSNDDSEHMNRLLNNGRAGNIVGGLTDEDYADYLREMFFSDSEPNSDYNYSDTSEADRIVEDFMSNDTSSSLFFYANRVTQYLQNFRNTATPIVRARIQDFIRSMSSSIPYSNLEDAINAFRTELTELTGNSLSDFPVFSSEGLNITPRTGLSDSKIASLPRYYYHGQSERREKHLNESPHSCCICVAEFEMDEELILLETCSHQFHSECLVSWFRRSDQCPICRKVVK